MINKWIIVLAFLALSADAGAAMTHAPDFSLKNWDGRDVSLRDLKDKIVVLTFSYAHCSVRCPIVTGRLSGLDKTLHSADSLVYLHVSVDPENDTPARRKKYFSLYGIDAAKDSRWVFLSGKKEELSKLWKAYGLAAKKVRDRKLPEGYYMDFDQKVFVIDAEGVVRYEGRADFSEDAVSALIEKLIARPSVKFTETRFDFGVVQEGDIVSHDFEFVNNGAGVLKIKDLVPS